MEDVMKNSPAATEGVVIRRRLQLIMYNKMFGIAIFEKLPGLLYDKVLCYEVNLSLPIWILPVIYRFVTELMVVYRVWG
ncbi:hypothetical protein L1987_37826 [Smallanthus sonchifolius]|uniref:Uncharacterized protein n=1 Tax=Smallanthus sonchifolius TaxID=185202 RepID=A0ACB9HK04_9ASTR|nr:hypothetical protein L1987_37826 [Smallanthus sonchifolius]